MVQSKIPLSFQTPDKDVASGRPDEDVSFLLPETQCLCYTARAATIEEAGPMAEIDSYALTSHNVRELRCCGAATVKG